MCYVSYYDITACQSQIDIQHVSHPEPLGELVDQWNVTKKAGSKT